MSKRSQQIRIALSDILNGIKDEWKLSIPELSVDLGIPEMKLKRWLAQDGNALSDKERESHLIAAARSIEDLSKVTGLSPKTIALDGELGLAFGARGSGKAMATYKNKIINLTRNSGFGSLAHELGHALDNGMGIKQNTYSKFSSDSIHSEKATGAAAAMNDVQTVLERVRARIRSDEALACVDALDGFSQMKDLDSKKLLGKPRSKKSA